MQNRTIHGYIATDYELVWTVINKDIAELEGQLKTIKV
jgi:uncharacterized protein with HEPN domain